MARKLNNFEEQVLRRILETEGLPLTAGLPGTRVHSENHTGVGKYLNFTADDDAEGKKLEIINTRVRCNSPQIDGGAGFLLYLHQGRLFCLECFAYGEHFPEGEFTFTLSA